MAASGGFFVYNEIEVVSKSRIHWFSFIKTSLSILSSELDSFLTTTHVHPLVKYDIFTGCTLNKIFISCSIYAFISHCFINWVGWCEMWKSRTPGAFVCTESIKSLSVPWQFVCNSSIPNLHQIRVVMSSEITQTTFTFYPIVMVLCMLWLFSVTVVLSCFQFTPINRITKCPPDTPTRW